MTNKSLSIHVESKNYCTMILTQTKIFTTFCWRSKMNQNKLYQDEFPITIALKGTRVNIYRHFRWKKLISLICFLIKIQIIFVQI